MAGREEIGGCPWPCDVVGVMYLLIFEGGTWEKGVVLRVGLWVGLLWRERLEKCMVKGHCTECGGWGIELICMVRTKQVIRTSFARVRCDAGEVQVTSCMCLKGVGGSGAVVTLY